MFKYSPVSSPAYSGHDHPTYHEYDEMMSDVGSASTELNSGDESHDTALSTLSASSKESSHNPSTPSHRGTSRTIPRDMFSLYGESGLPMYEEAVRLGVVRNPDQAPHGGSTAYSNALGVPLYMLPSNYQELLDNGDFDALDGIPGIEDDLNWLRELSCTDEDSTSSSDRVSPLNQVFFRQDPRH